MASNELHAHLALRLGHAETAERLGELGAREADQRGLRRRHIALERRLLEEGQNSLIGHDCRHLKHHT
jgi:hypothetical protein